MTFYDGGGCKYASRLIKWHLLDDIRGVEIFIINFFLRSLSHALIHLVF